ncbi:SDR family NAD(P)-dependent oxidoreductase [Rhodopila sp.]|jgi:NAD(P)-dependent dehydrogenase (short-subunit alcohol dehydrogenase family)|uniref:SDR family NAD(P)-dependent oxidoreductase n=1 Tax=Rhodopila sp. TaxID=2480087 RepID=UPI002B8F2619|nr:SDR family NAD(P)-dependent oxidoreductase [Rhodopila sp.]HVZ07379.1 SDR family NAD(P)-dependent oxidoreductase [Rhodopila sp.]
MTAPAARQAVVTGGTRGIGLAVADRLAAEGWSVLTLARRPVAAHPHRFTACDVTDPAAVRAALGPLDRVDALVTCAGLAGANRLEGDDALWHAIIDTNLHGTYHACKAVLPKLPDGTGRIVTIASVLGLRGVADQTAYCAAKHGVIGFTRALALAAAPRGITVNALCPGWVETAMAHQRYAELGITPAEAASTVPTGHVATPEDVADAVVWLLRPGSRGITGHALPIDGGTLALP